MQYQEIGYIDNLSKLFFALFSITGMYPYNEWLQNDDVIEHEETDK